MVFNRFIIRIRNLFFYDGLIGRRRGDSYYGRKVGTRRLWMSFKRVVQQRWRRRVSVWMQ
jgi:hypothetical protein